MKFLDPAEHILLPVVISVRADTAELLTEMAHEMDVSMDEVLSAIAEDSVCDLDKQASFIGDVCIPDRVSRENLMKFLD